MIPKYQEDMSKKDSIYLKKIFKNISPKYILKYKKDPNFIDFGTLCISVEGFDNLQDKMTAINSLRETIKQYRIDKFEGRL